MAGEFIDIEEVAPWTFDVAVKDRNSSRQFRITVDSDFFNKHEDGHSKREFVKDCFRFLLEREPKESILGEFDVSVIPEYFPEFEKEF